jgi:galactose mutarotase-like enzyme
VPRIEADGRPSAIDLRHGAARATIARRGAEALIWRIGDRDMLWSGDPAWWGQVAPVLFPICGAARDDIVRFGGVPHPMPLHGFAAGLDFAIAATTDNTVVLTLTDGPATRPSLPFPFRLALRYALTDNDLSIDLDVTNPGPEPLPYALGLHPGFALPGGVGAVEFEAVESETVPVVRDRLFTAERRPSGVAGRRLDTGADTFARGALCFLDAASRSLRMSGPDGHGVGVRFEGFPHLVLWGRPGAPFLAVEAWTGHGDSVGFSGDFAERASMRLLPPGETASYGAVFSAF